MAGLATVWAVGLEAREDVNDTPAKATAPMTARLRMIPSL